MKITKMLLAILLMSTLAGTAHAALINNGDGTLTDDVSGLMWLANANYAKTSGYDTDGLMTWAVADAWAKDLSYAGHDDWRLPTTAPALSGASQTGSEMGNLFYNVLGGVAGAWIGSIHNAHYDLFTIDPFGYFQFGNYWSGTDWSADPASAWSFGFDYGGQNINTKTISNYALAVRPAATAVPVPGAFWLTGTGLAGLCGMRRKK